MAEAWAKKLGGDIFDVYSAGTHEYPRIKPLAVKVLEEEGLDMSHQYPKLLNAIPPKVDILITMGCDVECPFVSSLVKEDWNLEDPSGGPIEDYRICSSLIKEKVINLISKYKNI
jgi:protein-tyrosine-phosphatase